MLLEDFENITFADINDTIVRRLIKLRLLSRSWIVDPFKCEIPMIPEGPSGFAEAIHELRYYITYIKARI